MEGERGREGGREGERERETLKQNPCSAQSPTRGSIPRLWDHDLGRNQELDTQPIEPPRCPPCLIFYNYLCSSFPVILWTEDLGRRGLVLM